MKVWQIFLYSFVCVGIFYTHTNLLLAQSTSVSGIHNPRIVLDDRYPEPGQTITAAIENFKPETNEHSLEWYINNSHQASNNDLREIEIVAPELGNIVTIQAKHRGQTIAQTTFTPVYVDIVVDPDTYVPHRFKARPVVTPDSYVTFTAIVEEGDKLPADNYRYEWKKNGSSVSGDYISGSQITIPLENRKDHTISVTVTHPTRGVIGQRFIQIPMEDAQIHFYEMHALYGKSSLALGSSMQLTGNQLQLQAVPYYFNNEVLRAGPEVLWNVDGNTIQIGGNTLTLQRNRSQGRVDLEFIIRGQDIMDQRMQQRLKINY